MMLPTTTRMIEPATVPQIRPVPPRSGVPPMTTAVIACNSHSRPVLGVAELRRGT